MKKATSCKNFEKTQNRPLAQNIILVYNSLSFVSRSPYERKSACTGDTFCRFDPGANQN
jgi:hypothetical protein